MWLTGKLVPDHKTIADFRRDDDPGIRKVCAHFVELCRRIGTLKGTCVAVEGSKFKTVNNRDKNSTKGKMPAASPIPRCFQTNATRILFAQTRSVSGQRRVDAACSERQRATLALPP